MTTSKTLLTTILIATVGAAAPAQADAPAKFSKQTVAAKAGQQSPVTVPGTGLKKGMTLKRGQLLVQRTATLDGRQGRTTLTCTGGRRLQGLALSELGSIGFKTASGASYVGKRSVAVVAFESGKDDGEPTGRILALCR